MMVFVTSVIDLCSPSRMTDFDRSLARSIGVFWVRKEDDPSSAVVRIADLKDGNYTYRRLEHDLD